MGIKKECPQFLRWVYVYTVLMIIEAGSLWLPKSMMSLVLFERRIMKHRLFSESGNYQFRMGNKGNTQRHYCNKCGLKNNKCACDVKWHYDRYGKN